MLLLGRSPLRVSFAGGGTDLEEYHNEHTGYTISSTIDMYTYVIAKLRKDTRFQGFSPDFASHLKPEKYARITPLQGHEIALACLKEMGFSRGVDMFFCSDVPPASGLGASSSLASTMVSVILTLQRKEGKWSKEEIAMKAYRIGHNLLNWAIGKQDEFAAVCGGLNLFRYTKNRVDVEPIILNKSTEQELQENSMLFYLGHRKDSSTVLDSQVRNIKNRRSLTLEALNKSAEIALEMRDSLKSNDLVHFIDLIKKGWEEKKKFSNVITNPRIEATTRAAFKSGAKALKITGAGGGGHLLVYADRDKQEVIESILSKMNVKRVDFRYQKIGTTVFEVGDL